MSRPTVQPILAALFAVALVGSAVAGVGIAQETPVEQPDEPADTTQSFVRILHASPDAPAVDVLVENETLLTGLAFGESSGYVPLAPGTYNVTVAVADSPESVVFDGNVTVERGATTLAATGEAQPNSTTGFELTAFEDGTVEPGPDEAAVRIVHLSPDAPAVDVTTPNGTVLAENVSFREATGYVTVPAGNYTAQVRVANMSNNGTVVAEANVSLAGGTAASGLAVGFVEPDESDDAEQPFQVALLEDATFAVQLPGADEAPPEEPCEAPTEEPGEAPTEEPGEAPTEEPGEAPTEEPGEAPTEEPMQ